MTDIKKYKGVAMLFGDTHFPYEDVGTFKFLKEVRDTFNPDIVVHTGDVTDQYGMSSYPTDVDHPDSWSEELSKARKKVARLGKLFPELIVVESNHDDRAYRKAKFHKVAQGFLKTFEEVINAPKSWEFVRDVIIEDTVVGEKSFVAHHKAGGKNGAIFCAKDYHMHAYLGHHHTQFGIDTFKTPTGKVLFGVDVGCLISDKGAPFAYNKTHRGKAIQGCIIINKGVPVLIPKQ